LNKGFSSVCLNRIGFGSTLAQPYPYGKLMAMALGCNSFSGELIVVSQRLLYDLD